MAVELDEIPELPRHETTMRWNKYKWDEWFNGSAWGLKEGEDFDCVLRVMRQQAANKAKRIGIKIQMKTDFKNRILYIKAEKKGGKERVALAPAGEQGPKESTPRVDADCVQQKAKDQELQPRGQEFSDSLPESVDPVPFVFGDTQQSDLGAPKPAPAKPALGFVFGSHGDRDW